MDAIDQTQVFFFISSVGFVTLWILIAVFLVYLIRISRTFSRIINKVEGDINSIGDTTKEMLEEVRESSLFQFLIKFFKSKKNKSRKGGGGSDNWRGRVLSLRSEQQSASKKSLGALFKNEERSAKRDQESKRGYCSFIQQSGGCHLPKLCQAIRSS